MPTPAFEGRASEGRSAFLSVPCPMEPLKRAQKIFQKHLGAYELKLGLPASYKAVASAADPRHKAKLILET